MQDNKNADMKKQEQDQEQRRQQLSDNCFCRYLSFY